MGIDAALIMAVMGIVGGLSLIFKWRLVMRVIKWVVILFVAGFVVSMVPQVHDALVNFYTGIFGGLLGGV
ncbi:MAG: hypothetical protein WED05_10030 [Candidatus Atabeyarchaeum deiterrae]